MWVCHTFLISLSVRPGSCAAIADHLRCHVKFSRQRKQEHDDQKTVQIHTEVKTKSAGCNASLQDCDFDAAKI
jgi:hypothetical protein